MISRAPAVEERSPGYGWMRRTVYGGGGWMGTAWRKAARPLGWGWRVAARSRLEHRVGRAIRLPAPAICVGNVTVGGGGKTSLVRWLLAEGLPAGARAAVLTRGYGRTGRGVRILPPGETLTGAEPAGDEPVLMARDGAWVGIGRNRVQAAHALLARCTFDLFLLDDGLQHRHVARALDLVTFTADDLTAPARCLPAGPLRQDPAWIPPLGGWVVAGVDPRGGAWAAGTIGSAFARWWAELPGTSARWGDGGTVALAAWRTGKADPFDPQGRPIVAFAGVARPSSVARFAAQAGYPVERTIAFRDHHRYTQADAAALRRAHAGAAFLTTEKDAVKCPAAWFGARPVGVLRRRLEPEDPALLRGLVREALAWPR